MQLRCIASLAVAAVAGAIASAGAQKPPVVRALGPIERVSTESLASVAAALPMPDGRVLVNDITAHRVLLFDSALAKALVVADTTGATANAYGAREGTLISYRADSALFIDPSSLSILVIGPAGTIGRIMAIPRPGEAQYLIGSVFGTPGLDARGRLVYYARAGFGGGTFILSGSIRIGSPAVPRAVIEVDSALIVRVDLDARTLDTVTSIKIPKVKTMFNADDQGFVKSIQTMYDPLPVVDAWAVTSDGTIAIVRGRDYHVDWLTPDGKWSSSPKMPFDWQRVSDERKLALIDSAAAARQAEMDAVNAARPSAPGGASGGGRGGGRGAAGLPATGGTPPAGAARGGRIPNVEGKIDVADLPDYVPPFAQGALRPDADGNLWIRTTTMAKEQPVYDVVNRHGELTNRVQLPPFRTIVGFGRGVIYMAVKDAAGVVHLERARVK